jgi:hypothetical protein
LIFGTYGRGWDWGRERDKGGGGEEDGVLKGNTFFEEEPDLVAGREEVVVTYVLAALSG